MANIYLNELSVAGQFANIDAFAEAALPIMKCLKYIEQRRETIYKHSGFYTRKITPDKTWNDLRGMRNDKITRLKSLLLRTTDQEPFWDLQEVWKQDLGAVYQYNGESVSGTVVAEAAETQGTLLSFPIEAYEDKKIVVVKNRGDELETASATTLYFLSGELWTQEVIDIHEYLQIRYAETRLDFSQLEESYGLYDFEKEEIKDCLQSFDRFIQLESWDAIPKDRSLYYKKYSPSEKEKDWFRGGEYEGKEIYKFRCTNPKRCFGYREKDTFYVLRMERDHKISDHG